VERSQVSATGQRTVSCLCRIQRLLGQNDDNRVNRAVDCIDPPEVRLDHFLTGNLSGLDRFGQFPGAHSPQVCACRQAHAAMLVWRERRRQGAIVPGLSSVSSRGDQV
jgi:hypothetical protein